jgi:hypothetical protein
MAVENAEGSLRFNISTGNALVAWTESPSSAGLCIQLIRRDCWNDFKTFEEEDWRAATSTDAMEFASIGRTNGS